MAVRRLSESCLDRISCPDVWEDDEYPEDVMVVGKVIDCSPVPHGPDEGVMRLPRNVIREANI